MQLNDLDRARRINRTLGTRCAASFMRRRGWSLESALFVLLNAWPRS